MLKPIHVLNLSRLSIDELLDLRRAGFDVVDEIDRRMIPGW